ncbi:ABC transporter transmembrane domain-containing protein, partial [Gemmatimonadota bacterium]
MEEQIPQATGFAGSPLSAPSVLPRGAGKLLQLFSPEERVSLWWLSLAVLVRGVVETFAVATVMPFIAVVASPEIIGQNPWLAWLYGAGSFQSTSAFLLSLGLLVLLALALSNGFAAWTTWIMERFVWRKHHELSTRLLRKYLHQPYAFFLDRNTAELSKNILSEVLVVITGVLVPFMLLVSRGVVAACVVTLLFLVDWSLALVVLLILGGAYGLVYAVVHRQQGRIGQERLDANTLRFQFASEAFGGIKETKVTEQEGFFLGRFEGPSEVYSRHTATDQVVAQLPRYALEVVAFGGILLIVLVLLSAGELVDQALPLIGLYAFAGYKLMPALQLVFQGLTRIRFNLPALEELHDHLRSDGAAPSPGAQDGSGDSEIPLPFQETLAVKGLGFRYPGTDEWAIQGIDLEVARGSSLG